MNTDELVKLREFKKELKQLLDKYDAILYWGCGDGSDLWGIYDEKMGVMIDNKEYTLAEGSNVGKEDL